MLRLLCQRIKKKNMLAMVKDFGDAYKERRVKANVDRRYVEIEM